MKSDNKHRGIVPWIIRKTPRRFLEKVLEMSGLTFGQFFGTYVIEANRRNLLLGISKYSSNTSYIRSAVGHSDMKCLDISSYRALYVKLLGSIQDKRERSGMSSEITVLTEATRRGMPRVPFASGGFTPKYTNNATDLEILIHAADKLDMRVGAALSGALLSDYTITLITEGMFRAFAARRVVPAEAAILTGTASGIYREGLFDDAQDTIYERLSAEFTKAMSEAYPGGGAPDITGATEAALVSIRYGLSTTAMPKPGTVPVSMDANLIEMPASDNLTNPPLVESPVITDLSDEGIGLIIADNGKRALDAWVAIRSPAPESVVASFRAVLSSNSAATDGTKIKAVWERLRQSVRAEVLVLAQITGSKVDANAVSDEICRGAYEFLMSRGVIPEDAAIATAPDDEMTRRIRSAIDDHTTAGGLTKSEITRIIGRHNSRYIPQTERILGMLVESGRYRFESGRYIAYSGNPITARSVKARTKRKPRQAALDEGIVREVDEGMLGGFKPKKAKQGEELVGE